MKTDPLIDKSLDMTAKTYPQNFGLEFLLSDFSIESFDSSSNRLFPDFLKTPFFIQDYYRDGLRKVLLLIALEKSDFGNSGRGHNPFFDNAKVKYFVAKARFGNKKVPIGRVIAYYDSLYHEDNKSISWIGGFESVNSDFVGNYLLRDDRKIPFIPWLRRCCRTCEIQCEW